MPGGKPWAQRGTEGSGETVAVTNRPDVQQIDATQTVSLASGGGETVEIYAPSGSVYNMRYLRYRADAPANATTGSHEVYVKPVGTYTVLYGESNYNSRLQYIGGQWADADLTKTPANETVARSVEESLRATESSALVLDYNNLTDVSQDNDRVIRPVVEEVTY